MLACCCFVLALTQNVHAQARRRQEQCSKEAQAKQAKLLQRVEAFKPVTGAVTQVNLLDISCRAGCVRPWWRSQ